MLPSARQVRAARALLGWSQAELAKRAEISESALYRFEVGQGDTKMATVEAVIAVLSGAGIQFLPETDVDGEGIRLKKGAGVRTRARKR